MRIRYVGNGVTVREVGELRWWPGNDFVCEVADAEMAAGLLTQPRGDFAVDGSEPLLAIAGHHTENLTLAGVASVTDLAGLDEAGVERVADSLGERVRNVMGWKALARSAVGSGEWEVESGGWRVEGGKWEVMAA